MRQTTVRRLGPDEAVPSGQPSRHTNASGVRLRWKVGPASYIECYEHRVVDGVHDPRVAARPGGFVDRVADNNGSSARPEPTETPSPKPKGPSATTRREVAERSGGWCEARVKGCQHYAVHLHHRRLRSQGGKHGADNLSHVCNACHGWIHMNPADAYALGLLVRISA